MADQIAHENVEHIFIDRNGCMHYSELQYSDKKGIDRMRGKRLFSLHD